MKKLMISVILMYIVHMFPARAETNVQAIALSNAVVTAMRELTAVELRYLMDIETSKDPALKKHKPELYKYILGGGYPLKDMLAASFVSRLSEAEKKELLEMYSSSAFKKFQNWQSMFRDPAFSSGLNSTCASWLATRENDGAVQSKQSTNTVIQKLLGPALKN